jgi:hypothetical protein
LVGRLSGSMQSTAWVTRSTFSLKIGALQKKRLKTATACS